jgi:LysR family transcriptional regulator, transcriptional activator for bauABCD operon
LVAREGAAVHRKALLGNVTDNDLRLLRVFRAVVACGGFAAAELELNINRSTISRHIKDLEARLGFTLCRRGRAGFALTDEGARFHQTAQKMMTALEDYQHDVNDINQRLSGPLTVAIFDKTASNPACHIDRALALFDEQAPGVHLKLHVEPINAIERGVMEGRFHLGIIPDHRPSSSLGYLPQHYAESFVRGQHIRALATDRFHYVCQFSAILRQSPPPSRVVATLLEALVGAH